MRGAGHLTQIEKRGLLRRSLWRWLGFFIFNIDEIERQSDADIPQLSLNTLKGLGANVTDPQRRAAARRVRQLPACRHPASCRAQFHTIAAPILW